jgi:hypothetical protein
VAVVGAPEWARPAAAVATGCVALSLWFRSAGAVAAAGVCVALMAAGRAGLAQTAAEGLLLLGYLLLLDLIDEPASRPRLPVVLAAVAGTCLVSAAALLPAFTRAAGAVTGMIAIVVAYALAVPRDSAREAARRPSGGRGPWRRAGRRTGRSRRG